MPSAPTSIDWLVFWSLAVVVFVGLGCVVVNTLSKIR
jgi:hypothetical protein